MNLHFNRIKRKIDLLPVRSRILVLLSTFLSILYLSYALFILPMQSEVKSIKEKILAQGNENKSVNEQFNIVQAELKTLLVDPNISKKDELIEENNKLDTSLSDISQSLVSPEKMAAMLHDILINIDNLQLIEMKSLAPEKIKTYNQVKVEKASNGKTEKGKEFNFYLHGLELTIQGSYFGFITYLQKIEESPWRLFWDKFEYTVDNYPLSTAKITVYSLSHDDNWLTV